MTKVMCGLWHANVHVSKHNDNGKCPCISCFGTHCHTCETYNKYQDEIINIIDAYEETRCQLCQMYEPKVR